MSYIVPTSLLSPSESNKVSKSIDNTPVFKSINSNSINSSRSNSSFNITSNQQYDSNVHNDKCCIVQPHDDDECCDDNHLDEIKLTFGQMVSDYFTLAVGSWSFIIGMSGILIIWVYLNSTFLDFDPYPFILMNLILSFIAAYSTPIIMMSQNRASEIDRVRESSLSEKIDHMRLCQLIQIYETLYSQTIVLLDFYVYLIEHNTEKGVLLRKTGAFVDSNPCLVEHRHSRRPSISGLELSKSIDDMRSQLRAYNNVHVSEATSMRFNTNPLLRSINLAPHFGNHQRSNSFNRLSSFKAPLLDIFSNDTEELPNPSTYMGSSIIAQVIPKHEPATKSALTELRGKTRQASALSISNNYNSEELPPQEFTLSPEEIRYFLEHPNVEMSSGEELKRTKTDDSKRSWFDNCWRSLCFTGGFRDDTILFGQHIATVVSEFVGSWTFVIWQSIILAFWLAINSINDGAYAWDPYPFVLLNLGLSTQAAFAAPIIMMSQNRAAEIEEIRKKDIHTNVDHIRFIQMESIGDCVSIQKYILTQLEKLKTH